MISDMKTKKNVKSVLRSYSQSFQINMMNKIVRPVYLRNIVYCWLVVVISLISALPTRVLAQQDQAGSIRVESVKTTNYLANVSGNDSDDINDYRFVVGYYNPQVNYQFEECITFELHDNSLGWVPASETSLPDGAHLVFNDYVPDPTQTVQVFATAWEDDTDGTPCVKRPGDDLYTGTQYDDFRYYDSPPGIKVYRDFFLAPGIFIRYAYRRTLPVPAAPYITVPNPGLLCEADPKFTFVANTYLNPVYFSGYSFSTIWEYSIGSLDPNNFRQLPNSTSPMTANSSYRALENYPIRSIPGLENININTTVYFRVRTTMYVSSGTEAGNTFYSTPSTVGISLELSPVPPTIVSAVSSPSCPNSSTGSIDVKIAGTGLGEYIYVLRPGVRTTPCTPNPETGIDDCGSPAKRVTSNDFTIPNVAKGRYTLMVTNRGAVAGRGDAGVCPSFQIVDVGEIEVLDQTVSTISASCFGAADGEVTLTATGGIANYEYTLSQGTTTLTSTDGKFENLLAGTYTASTTDGCGQIATKSDVTVAQPIKTEATVTSTSPSCSDPTNCSISVSVTQGSGHYTHQLIKDNVVVHELAASTTTSWQLQNLAVGSYTLKIIDANHALCTPFSQAIDLVAPLELSLPSQNVSIQNSTCYRSNNGEVSLINGEGGSTVLYTLTNQAAQAVLSPSVDLKFSNLAPGNYQLTKKRNVPGCRDQFDYPIITITEPQQVSITLTKKDIRCHGEDDGAITSSVAGATPTDRYQWELNLAGSWVTLPQTTSSLTNLSAGTYRLKLIGSNQCEVQSDEVEIIDPAVFSISSVQVTDTKCLGELGRVVAIVTGGFAPYTYHYSSTAGDTDATTENVELGVGTYTLKISDAGGCEIAHPQPISISSPSTALSFTHTLSNFSGFNVPCQGSSGGYVDILAAGGNGGTYTGYQYSIDGFNYQSDARIGNLKTGAYTMYVRDNRGCVITDQTTLTEPAAQIVVELVSKTDVKCQGDLSGVISIGATGGTAPYSFVLNGTQPQNVGLFSGLTSGDYIITVRDANGCSADYAQTIQALVAPMTVVLQKTDISCFGLSDGAIKAEVTGGAAPLRYEWSDKNENVAMRQNLPLGDYTLRVIDGEGCFQNGSASIAQPDQITPSSTAIPVCVGQLTGEIRMKAEGGIGPFQYSLNDKTNYQSSGTFTNVRPGDHKVYVKDFTNCEVVYQTQVTVRNDKPEPDFIVASKENAQDTLVAVEISVPKPDSVEWTFDPNIIILNNDAWSPVLKVAEAGVYPVSMKGYFGGCEYSKAHSLTIGAYDPDKKSTVRLYEKAIKQISITPNPNNGTFNIAVELNFKQRVYISVFDVMGITHYKSNWEKATSIAPEIVLPSGTPPGVYVVQVVTDTEVQQDRIIIDR
jgi:hypothetical protein